jgi:hypothetical protein
MTLVRRTARGLAAVTLAAGLSTFTGATLASAAIPGAQAPRSGGAGVSDASPQLPAKADQAPVVWAELGGASAVGGGLVVAGAVTISAIRRRRLRTAPVPTRELPERLH